MNVQVEKIVDTLSKYIEEDCLITGGHFMLDENKPKELNEGTIDSFRAALLLYKLVKKKYPSTGLGVLLNDIGQVCSSADHCSIQEAKKLIVRDEFKFPTEYLKILEEEHMDKSELIIYWEKHMRNRGKKIFNKLKKTRDDILQKDGEYYLADSDGYGDIVLLRQMVSDKYGTPACPLIMGAYALEQQRRGFRTSLNLYYIGNDNNTNIPNHIVIEKGKRVADLFGAKINVKNVYFTTDNVLKNF